MIYEAGLITLLLGFLVGCFLYKYFWIPKVVNKSADFFKVSQIEKRFLTGGEKFFALISFLWIVLLYDYLYKAIVNGSDSDIGGVVVTLFLLMVWNLFKWLIYRKKHECIPVKRNLDVKTQISMIEQERFIPIAENLWHSPNWIRVAEKFFPKNTVLGISVSQGRGNSSVATIIVHAVDGKEYRCNEFWNDDPFFYEKVYKLMDTLPIRNMYEKREGEVWIGLRDVKKTDMFDFYMQSHTTQELIINPELVISMSKALKDK